MTQSEIDLLQHELLLRGVNMVVSESIYHMDYDKALSICLDVYAGFTFKDAIETYDKRID